MSSVKELKDSFGSSFDSFMRSFINSSEDIDVMPLSKLSSQLKSFERLYILDTKKIIRDPSFLFEFFRVATDISLYKTIPNSWYMTLWNSEGFKESYENLYGLDTEFHKFISDRVSV